eukprot:2240454-Amphidinium_carterae.2
MSVVHPLPERSVLKPKTAQRNGLSYFKLSFLCPTKHDGVSYFPTESRTQGTHDHEMYNADAMVFIY